MVESWFLMSRTITRFSLAMTRDFIYIRRFFRKKVTAIRPQTTLSESKGESALLIDMSSI